MKHSQINLTKVRGFLLLIGIVLLVGCSSDYDKDCLDELASFECSRNGYRTYDAEISLKGFLSSPFIICTISSDRTVLIDLNETDVNVCDIINVSLERYKILESRWLPNKCYAGDTYNIIERDDWICCHKSPEGGYYTYNVIVNGENRTLDLPTSLTCDEYDEIERYWESFGCSYSIGDCEELQREYELTGKIYVPFAGVDAYCDDLTDSFDMPFIPDCNNTKEVKPNSSQH